MIEAAIHAPILEDADERREIERQAIILRVAVLDQKGKPSFCLVRNVSSAGMQVKIFTDSLCADNVVVHIADEFPICATVVWIHGGSAGIQFGRSLSRDALLRLQQKLGAARRRSTPRVSAVSQAALRIGHRTIQAKLADISCMGARVTTSRRLEPGRQIFLRLPDLPDVQAEVRWTEASAAGLIFKEAVEIDVLAEWIDGRLRVTA